MRVIPILTSLFVLGLFLYAVISFSVVSMAINPGASPFGGVFTARPKAPPLPLEKAAPEVVKLRPAFRDLAATAQQVVALCPNRDSQGEPARPRGKVLIWDVGKDDVSEAHGRLPIEWRLHSPDDPCTVYLITERDRQAVMNYNYDFFSGGGSSGVKGYRTDLVVCAVDLPTMQPRGRFRINGNGPPQHAQMQPSLKEIDEDWADNVKQFLGACVKGPEPQYYSPPQQGMPRYADEARKVLDQCEVLGSLRALPNMPGEVIVWNPQTDRTHPAHGHIQNKGYGSTKPTLVIMVLDDQFRRDMRVGHFDYRVALVAFPGARALGVYQVRGEDWPLPRKADDWWPTDPNLRDPTRALSRWVSGLSKNNRGLPPGTMPLSFDAVHLAGSDWLKGPGWQKRLKNDLPEDMKVWSEMAEECTLAMDICKAKGSPGNVGKLPKKIVVWVDYAEVWGPCPANDKLPKALQAGKQDREVLMAIDIDSDYVLEPKNDPRTERFDNVLALFTMPGAHPVGVYRVRGETLKFNRDRNSPNAKNADTAKDMADWLKRFVESPQTVAATSAVH
jgi:hypothetical protein